MKTPLLLLAATLAIRALAVETPEPVIPQAFPPERYEALLARSPFALATPVAPPPAPPDKSFSDGWYVGSLARLDGKDFVTIKARDMSTSFTLYGDAPSNGVTLQKVDWSATIGGSKVTIEKDGQSATLEFNQAELQASAAPPMPVAAPGGVRPPIPGGGNAGAPRPTVPRPTQPVVQPQAYGTTPNLNANIPRPGGSVVTVPGANSGIAKPPGVPVVGGVSSPATPDARRRIRVINNVPAQPQ